MATDKRKGPGLGPVRVSPPGAKPKPRQDRSADAPRADKRPFKPGGFKPRSDGPGGGPRAGGPRGGGQRGFGPRGPKPAFDRPRFAPRATLNIVFEDDDLLIVDKPSGLLSANLPGETRESLFDMVKDHIRSARKGKKRVWIIHRLDKEASGLLVFAKSEKAFHWLKEDFKAKRVKRLYVAVVEGEIGGDAAANGQPKLEGRSPATNQLPSGTIQSFIAEDEFGNVKSVGVGETARNTGAEARRERWSNKPSQRPGETPDKPQLAVTHYRVMAVGQKRTLLQLRLDTGRKNQIRLHMKEFAHPIIGDRRFGAKSDPIQRVALHATDLGFTHPSNGKQLRFVSPAPESFYRVVGAEPPDAERPDNAVPDAASVKPAADTSWDHVAEWYDQLLEDGKSDHFDQVILPGTLRLLNPLAGMNVLDIACGQGMLCRKLAELGLKAVGVDAAPRLIEAARTRAEGLPLKFEVADARELPKIESLGGELFDAATCVMAFMNIDPLEPVLRGAASLLKPGGALVGVILHPAFRAPGQSSWGWAEEGSKARRQVGTKGAEAAPETKVRQYRRIDGYLSPGQTPITMNPGYAAHGAERVETWTFHRPLQTYTRLLAEAGFLIETFEEWPSRRISQPGPRAAEENRIRREIPLFLGFRAIKRAE